MRTRLAMMSCKGPYTTPWMATEGGESGLRIIFLMEGEHVTVEDGAETHRFDSPGEFPFHPSGPRIRFSKERLPGVEGSPTLVEVLYNE